MKRLCLAMVCVFAWSTGAWADKREYLEVLPYFSTPEGETELQLWNDWFDGLPRTQLEIEHGFTNRLSSAVYFIAQDQGQGYQYTFTMLEVRYRLARYKKFFMDPALYTAYQKGANGAPDHIESALILSKDLADFNVTGNFFLEKDVIGPNSPLNPEFHYSVGVSYPLSKPTTYGLELLVQPQQHQSFLIPGIYTVLGKRVWLNLGLQVALQPSRNPINVRSIVSIGL